MVMCASTSCRAFLDLCHKHPGKVGTLIGPSSWRYPQCEYALDNDAFLAWKNSTVWNESAWRTMLVKAGATHRVPLWVLVPDVVANRQATLENWRRYVDTVHAQGWQAAFAVQDGMTPEDVPSLANVVFIGGTTQWKWRTLPMWASSFPRVHLGRCGTSRWKLERLESLGVESCDGSGWFRATANGREARQLRAYLAHDKHIQEEFATW